VGRAMSTRKAIKPDADIVKASTSLIAANIKWTRLRASWQRNFHMAINGETLPWLFWRGGIGCVACHVAGCDNAYAEFSLRSPTSMQAVNFKKHQSSGSHSRAVKYLCDVIAGKEDASAREVVSPTRDEFGAVWHACHSSALGDVPTQDSRFRTKSRRIEFCLAESCRDQLRSFMRQASSMTLSQDGSKGRQLSRFTASNSRLETCSGVFCLKFSPCGDHKSIIATTSAMYSTFATRLHGAPSRGDWFDKPAPPVTDEALKQHC